jgi:DNA-binding NtrC family response regulator
MVIPSFELCVFWGEEVRRFSLPASGEVSLGRDEKSDVRIDHPSVSRKHAVLNVGSRLTIRDLGGTNGTLVPDRTRSRGIGETENVLRLNGDEATLNVGDAVTVGRVILVVRRTDADQPAFAELEQDAPASQRFVVRDAGMRTLYDQAARAARSLISVLILGETGVGKEVLARTIHARSPRAKGPFLGINCAALPESMLEAELFGHEKGAFTGALLAREGLFEAADGGTLFLDEVGELPAVTQAKLLRVLEERRVMRLGARTPRDVDVRFVAATNRDLEAASNDGAFRQDLYFRLNGISLMIPPLRERTTEIEPLIRAFVTASCKGLDRETELGISPEAVALLTAYSWPGNVRELRNAIERAVVLCTGDTIFPDHLPTQIRTGGVRAKPQTPAPTAAATSAGLRDEMRDLERVRIVQALEECNGNQTEAAKKLGISRRTLLTRLDQFNLPRPRKS